MKTLTIRLIKTVVQQILKKRQRQKMFTQSKTDQEFDKMLKFHF